VGGLVDMAGGLLAAVYLGDPSAVEPHVVISGQASKARGGTARDATRAGAASECGSDDGKQSAAEEVGVEETDVTDHDAEAMAPGGTAEAAADEAAEVVQRLAAAAAAQSGGTSGGGDFLRDPFTRTGSSAAPRFSPGVPAGYIAGEVPAWPRSRPLPAERQSATPQASTSGQRTNHTRVDPSIRSHPLASDAHGSSSRAPPPCVARELSPAETHVSGEMLHALAAEIVSLLRILARSEGWREMMALQAGAALKAVEAAAAGAAPDVGELAAVDLHRALVALAVAGGMSEPLRVGGRARVRAKCGEWQEGTVMECGRVNPTTKILLDDDAAAGTSDGHEIGVEVRSDFVTPLPEVPPTLGALSFVEVMAPFLCSVLTAQQGSEAHFDGGTRGLTASSMAVLQLFGTRAAVSTLAAIRPDHLFENCGGVLRALRYLGLQPLQETVLGAGVTECLVQPRLERHLDLALQAQGFMPAAPRPSEAGLRRAASAKDANPKRDLVGDVDPDDQDVDERDRHETEGDDRCNGSSSDDEEYLQRLSLGVPAPSVDVFDEGSNLFHGEFAHLREGKVDTRNLPTEQPNIDTARVGEVLRVGPRAAVASFRGAPIGAAEFVGRYGTVLCLHPRREECPPQAELLMVNGEAGTCIVAWFPIEVLERVVLRGTLASSHCSGDLADIPLHVLVASLARLHARSAILLALRGLRRGHAALSVVDTLGGMSVLRRLLAMLACDHLPPVDMPAESFVPSIDVPDGLDAARGFLQELIRGAASSGHGAEAIECLVELCEESLAERRRHAGAARAIRIESAHPLGRTCTSLESCRRREIHIPGARALLVEFDPRCETEPGTGLCSLYWDAQCSAVLATTSGRGGQRFRPVVVAGSRCWFQFSGEGAGFSNNWGFRLQVTPLGLRPREDGPDGPRHPPLSLGLWLARLLVAEEGVPEALFHEGLAPRVWSALAGFLTAPRSDAASKSSAARLLLLMCQRQGLEGLDVAALDPLQDMMTRQYRGERDEDKPFSTFLQSMFDLHVAVRLAKEEVPAAPDPASLAKGKAAAGPPQAIPGVPSELVNLADVLDGGDHAETVPLPFASINASVAPSGVQVVPDNVLHVLDAVYGDAGELESGIPDRRDCDGVTADVTAEVRALVSSKGGGVRLQLALGALHARLGVPDPAPGRPKALRVRYCIKSREETAVPAPGTPPPSQGEASELAGLDGGDLDIEQGHPGWSPQAAQSPSTPSPLPPHRASAAFASASPSPSPARSPPPHTIPRTYFVHEGEQSALILSANQWDYRLGGDLVGVSLLNNNVVDMSLDGLLVRNVSQSFLTVRADVSLHSGHWYYEVRLRSGGLQQIGWADPRFRPSAGDGSGVGDDEHSWAFDGHRRRFWHSDFRRYGTEWLEGDVLGVLVDLEPVGGCSTGPDSISMARMSYTLNGTDLGEAAADVRVTGGLSPAASLSSGESCRFNFGDEPFQHPPPPWYQGLQRHSPSGAGWFDRVTSFSRAARALQAGALPPPDVLRAALHTVASWRGCRRVLQGRARIASEARGPALAVRHVGPAFSVALWVFPLEGPSGQWRTLFFKGLDNDQTRTPAAFVSPENMRVAFCVSTSTNWNDCLRSHSELPLRQWSHLVFVRDVQRSQLYINGELDAERPFTGATLLNEHPLFIGRMAAGFKRRESDYLGFESLVQDVSFYPCALTPGEVRHLHGDHPPDARVPDPMATPLVTEACLPSLTAPRAETSLGTGFWVDGDGSSGSDSDGGDGGEGRGERGRGKSTTSSLTLPSGASTSHSQGMRGSTSGLDIREALEAMASLQWTPAMDVAVLQLAQQEMGGRPNKGKAASQRAQRGAVGGAGSAAAQPLRWETWSSLLFAPELEAVVRQDLDAMTGGGDAHVLEVLHSLPVGALLLRYAVLQQFSDQVAHVFPLVDFTQRDVPGTLAHTICGLRNSISLATKVHIWERVVSATRCREERPSLTLNRPRATVLAAEAAAAAAALKAPAASLLADAEGKRTLFGQAFRQLSEVGAQRMRQSDRAWTVTLEGEGAEDYGGPFRESLSHMCKELQTPGLLPLLLPCPNATDSIGSNREKWCLNPGATSRTALAMLRFLGRIMGVALRTKDALDLDLPSLTWKPIAGVGITVADLAAIDFATCRAVDALRFIEREGVTEETFSSVFCETFTARGLDGRQVELVDGGAAETVTWERREEFSALVEQFKMNESSVQLKAIMAGLGEVVPLRYLPIFTPKELEARVCGQPDVDVGFLKQNTTYSGPSPSDPHVVHFWEVLEEFSPEDRRQFLRFVWGRSRLPPAGIELPRNFELQPFARASASSRAEPGMQDTFLPVAHTCFFSLELPTYSSKTILRDKLRYAIYECIAIDTDHAVRESSAWRFEDSESGGESEF